MIILAHDYETTGTDPLTCGVVQSALAIVEVDILGGWKIIAVEEALHHPGEPIPPGATRVHGIHDGDVAGRPHFEESLSETMEQAFSEFQPTAVLGYNSNRFDNVIARRFGLPEGLIELDMMTAANRLMTQGVITRARLVDAYEQLIGKDPDNAHDAMADVLMTLELIQPVMERQGFESFPDLVGWLTTPEVNTKMLMPFGKHKGRPLEDIPRDYLRWLLNGGNLHGDMEATIKKALR